MKQAYVFIIQQTPLLQSQEKMEKYKSSQFFAAHQKMQANTKAQRGYFV